MRHLAIACCLALSLISGNAVADAQLHDESFNFQPSLSLYETMMSLTDLVGPNGYRVSGPVSLAHRFLYMRTLRSPRFPRLKPPGDVDKDRYANTEADWIRYFATNCKFTPETGIGYEDLLTCSRQYLVDSSYLPWAYLIGPAAPDSPQGEPLESMKRPVRIQDLRSYLQYDFGVILGIGIYYYNPSNHTWNRTQTHYVNAYGYDYDRDWGEDSIILKVVNPSINYSERPSDLMFDDIKLKREEGPDGFVYRLRGRGFGERPQAFLENMMVVFPVTR